MRHKYPRPEPTQIKSDQFDAWAHEGHQVAKEAVYRKGALAGGPTKDAAALLQEDYASTAGAIAGKRAALAGYRLADRLARLE